MAGHDRSGDPTRLIDRPAAWEAYLASAIGADHVRAGTPNQDAIAATKFEFPDAPSLLAFAVADGHGHARHFRSDRGSKFAVKAGVAAARAWAVGLPAGAPIAQEAANTLVQDVVTAWRELVAADLAADPLTGVQAATVLPGDPPEIPYGATLLLGLLRPDVAVLAQIGDGEMLLILPDGRYLAPIPTDSRLDGTQTTSLCQPDAVSAFRIALVNLARTQVFAVFAATDGYGNAQAEFDWQQGVAADLTRMGSEYGLEWIGSRLGDWAALCASSQGSGDDSTVALSLNSAAVLTPPAKPQRRPFDESHDHTTLPYLRSATAGRTLTWPDEPVPVPWLAGPGEETRPVAAVQADYGPATATQPAFGGPGPAGSGYGPPRTRAFAGRPALWIGGAAVAALILIAVIVLLFHGRSGKTPAFRPNPGPTHTSATPTKRPTTSPTAKATTTPTSGSQT